MEICDIERSIERSEHVMGFYLRSNNNADFEFEDDDERVPRTNVWNDRTDALISLGLTVVVYGAVVYVAFLNSN